MRALILLAILAVASALPSRNKRQTPSYSPCDAANGGYWVDTPEYPSTTLFNLANTCTGSDTYPDNANYSIYFMLHYGQSYVNVAFNLSTEMCCDFVIFGANLPSDKQVRVSGQQISNFSVDITGTYDYAYRVDFRSDGSVRLPGVAIVISTSNSPQFPSPDVTGSNGYATTGYPNYWTDSYSTNYPYNPYPDYGYTTPYYGYNNPTTYYPYNPYTDYPTPAIWPNYPSYPPAPRPQYPYDQYNNNLYAPLLETTRNLINIAQNIVRLIEQNGLNRPAPDVYYGYAAAAGKKK